MRYWWVNQNQTYRQEVSGGYLWSPKRNANRARNPFYETMREVAPGDLVFSFCNTRICAVGIACSYAYECPKPEEFGSTGRNWERIGWRVDVRFTELATLIRPKDWMDVLRPHLPARYSPLQANGNGLQGVYLARLPETFALTLAELIGAEVAALARAELVFEVDLHLPEQEMVLWEDHLRKQIEGDESLPATERQQLVIARRGQGQFREGVQRRETRCRVTHVDRAEHLRASHCKPWRDCDSNAERLDANNGLMLTPSVDHLFDRGFISFENDGRLLVSPVAHIPSLQRMGIPAEGHDVGRFSTEQARYLEYHRDAVLLRSRLAG